LAVRRFLYVIAGCIVLILAAGIVWSLQANDLIRWWAVPSASFEQVSSGVANRYDDPALWIARPGLADDPSAFLPDGFTDGGRARGDAAVFYVHPTSFLDNSRWNAPLDSADANARAALFTRGQASAFTLAGKVWAPRYRQATFGAFLTDQPEATRALDAAYRDVAAAFDSFVAAIPPDKPIILAGHSQGSLHLTRLLKEKVAGRPIAKRIVAAYVVGWPVSLTADLPALGLPTCEGPASTGCVLSWASFAEPADETLVTDVYDKSLGLDGRSRGGSPIVCTNPLTGANGGSAPATANLGTLKAAPDWLDAELIPDSVPARCADRGFLLIGDPPAIGNYVLPGNNYHVYDYSLFWANVRADAARRLAAFKAQKAG